MVFRKKTYRKRPFRKTYKKRPVKAKKTVKAFKAKGNYVSQVFRTEGVPITVAAGAFGFYDFQPSISNIPANELAAYQELYDEYKICKIKLEIIPRFNQALSPSNIGFHWYSVVDKNDTNTLASPAAALEYNNCQRRFSTSKYVVNRMITPSLTTTLNDVAGLSFNVQGPPRWIQMANPLLPNNININHLGIKVISDINPNTYLSSQTYDVYETLLVQFRTKL